MKIGFTGTREGMSAAQREQLVLVLMALAHAPAECRPEFHHGGAVGADAEADETAAREGYAVVVHPCSPVLPPLTRNRNIVAECDVLVAAPRSDKEELRSGTWATVRYARQAGKPVVMLSRGKP